MIPLYVTGTLVVGASSVWLIYLSIRLRAGHPLFFASTLLGLATAFLSSDEGWLGWAVSTASVLVVALIWTTSTLLSELRKKEEALAKTRDELASIEDLHKRALSRSNTMRVHQILASMSH